MAEEFSEKLSAVLANPDAMGQILSLARSLTGDGAEDPVQSQAVDASPPTPAALPDLSGLLGMLGGLTGGGGDEATEGASPFGALSSLDPRILQTGMRLLAEYNHHDDRKTALLQALKPFLKEERAAKMDRAIQVAKLSRIARAGLQLFKEGGAGDDV